MPANPPASSSSSVAACASGAVTSQETEYGPGLIPAAASEPANESRAVDPWQSTHSSSLTSTSSPDWAATSANSSVAARLPGRPG